MEKKLLIDKKVIKLALKDEVTVDNLHTIKSYSYDYIRNYSPETFKNAKYFLLESCKHWITAKEESCYIAFTKYALSDEYVLVGDGEKLYVFNNINVLQEIIELIKKKGGK